MDFTDIESEDWLVQEPFVGHRAKLFESQDSTQRRVAACEMSLEHVVMLPNWMSCGSQQ